MSNATLENFLERFYEDAVSTHNVRCEMTARAIKAIGDSTKVTHAGGTCWRFPKVNKAGYGVTSVLHLSRVTSRLVLCMATGKPYDYHNEQGEYMIASHRTPIICRFRNCLNPEHLFWETLSDGSKRREAEARAVSEAGKLSSALGNVGSLVSIPVHSPTCA
jgi:hypothetical protein